MTEDRWQRTDGRGQKTEDKGIGFEVRGGRQKIECWRSGSALTVQADSSKLKAQSLWIKSILLERGTGRLGLLCLMSWLS